jgi:hypothetical protein
LRPPDSWLVCRQARGLPPLDFIKSTGRNPIWSLRSPLYPVTTPAGQLAVLTVAVTVLIGFLLWSKRATSASFFRGVLAGNGFIVSFDIVWVHWIFGLHHLTNAEMDLFLEPPLVLIGLVFLWFAITRERRQASTATLERSESE